jgi:hypothetical protein
VATGECTGVLHTGFDRHTSQNFEVLASQYLGKMLMTGAAKRRPPFQLKQSFRSPRVELIGVRTGVL